MVEYEGVGWRIYSLTCTLVCGEYTIYTGTFEIGNATGIECVVHIVCGVAVCHKNFRKSLLQGSP